MSEPKRLRHVVIGAGAGIFGTHRRALEIETAELVAVSDINTELGQQRADELGCSFYADHRTMLTETTADVAVILTPHPYHAAIAIDCFDTGCHVLVEKPMAVQVSEADAMIAAADNAQRLLAVNFQQRFRPEIIAARRLIQDGLLGDIQHVDMLATWPRTARYFKFAGWRGTWSGEGGGVLMNQAPHDLDLICHLVGAPEKVTAWTRTQFHAIETEDTAQAMLQWPNGAWGSVHISTAEAGRSQRLEIAGTNGILHIERGGLTFHQFDTELREFLKTSDELYRGPGTSVTPIELEPGAGNHAAVYENLHAAILNGTALMADGVEARKSLELANAMIYSSYQGQEVALPLDRHGYAALLEELKTKHTR
jgi:predicted dehydrogenase